jgi:hypothetical protein
VKVDASVPYKDRVTVTCITGHGNQDTMKSINYPNNFISREYIHWWKDDISSIRKHPKDDYYIDIRRTRKRQRLMDPFGDKNIKPICYRISCCPKEHKFDSSTSTGKSKPPFMQFIERGNKFHYPNLMISNVEIDKRIIRRCVSAYRVVDTPEMLLWLSSLETYTIEIHPVPLLETFMYGELFFDQGSKKNK